TRSGEFARILCLLFLAFAVAACPRNDKGSNGPKASGSESPAGTNTPTSSQTTFNGERAMDHVRKQVEFGPRVPGSVQLAKTRDYIINTLRDSAIKITTDEFIA